MTRVLEPLVRPDHLPDAYWAEIAENDARLRRELEAGDANKVVGAAKNLVEGIAKAVQELAGQEVGKNPSYTGTLGKAHDLLAGQHAAPELMPGAPASKIAYAAKNMAGHLGELRNDLGDGHAQAKAVPVIDEVVELCLDGAYTWVRWALRRLGPFAITQPATICSTGPDDHDMIYRLRLAFETIQDADDTSEWASTVLEPMLQGDPPALLGGRTTWKWWNTAGDHTAGARNAALIMAQRTQVPESIIWQRAADLLTIPTQAPWWDPTQVPLPEWISAHASIQGSEHPNQDTWHTTLNIAWVIDGATRPTSATGVVERYVDDLSGAIFRAARSFTSGPEATTLPDNCTLAQVLERAITETRTDQASATVAMARITPTGYDWLCLGDATIHTPTNTFTDDRLAHIAPELRAARATERATHGTSEHYHDLTTQLLAEEDHHRNHPNGFWVAGNNPDAAHHALTGHTTSIELALLTDGVADTLTPNDNLYAPHLDTTLQTMRSRLTEPIDDMTAVVLTRRGIS